MREASTRSASLSKIAGLACSMATRLLVHNTTPAADAPAADIEMWEK